ALLDVSTEWVHGKAEREATGRDGKGVVVGVVDTGLDVRHPDFRNADGTTRVAWMLVAGPNLGRHADVEGRFCKGGSTTKCGVYDAADLDQLLATGGEVPRDPEGHGTHVTSIAAGNGGAEKKYVGMAPGATIVVAAPEPSGGGFFDPDILNAVAFVFDRADALGLPCVVNLSIGGDFGAHDGTSDLEAGLAAMVGTAHPGHAIAVAAGNSGSLYDLGDGLLYGVHTEVHVSPDERVRAPMLAPKAEHGQGFVWLTFEQGDEVSVGLEGPGGETWIGQVDPGRDAGYEKKSDPKANASVINDEVSKQSTITQGSNSAVVTFDGAWDDKSTFAITLEGHGQAELWVTSGGDVSPEVSLGLQFERGIKQGTISVPATAPALLAVGCTVNRSSWQPLEGPPVVLTSFGGASAPAPDGACFFSGAGPTATGVSKPEVSAPGAFVVAAMAADADPRVHPGGLFDEPGCPNGTKCYVVDDQHAVAVGTSMSAPHATGIVALLLEGDPMLTQPVIVDALEAGARHATGPVPYDYQFGPGVLDAVGAEAALLDESDRPSKVDLGRSWYVLSAGYARADGVSPVWGTVELRKRDGAIATGVDASSLSVSLERASLLQDVAKVAPGLYRFSFAA
ncbi:MAG TPA: S8 family serine peptidase, partial [Minicystis sp.]|nr:S8 family serine peptidase [Minicystis sp.]